MSDSPDVPNGRADAPAGRAVWWEVAAVLAVGVVPHAVSAATHLFAPIPPLPYWLDALNLGVLSASTILVTLYLMARSGEPWARFGLPRPQLLDLPLGGFLLVVAVALGYALPRVPDFGIRTAPEFARPNGTGDYVLMVIKFALSAFSEELVTRAYLITRLSQLLRSRGEAVLFAALLFAAYHTYQGPDGLAYTFAFGLAYGLIFLALGRVWPLALGHALYNIRLELLVG